MAPVAVERLKTRRDFLRVAGRRRKWVTPGLILQAAPTPAGAVPAAAGPQAVPGGGAPTPRPLARVGFTVSKKVGNAVARNRARRRLKAAAAEVMPALATPGTDYVIIGRGMTLDRPWDALKTDLGTALRRVLSAAAEEPPGRRGERTGGPRGGRRPRRGGTPPGASTEERTTGQ
jgi:ribonuclease P protein component